MSGRTKDSLSYIASEAITALIDGLSVVAAGVMILIISAVWQGII